MDKKDLIRVKSSAEAIAYNRNPKRLRTVQCWRYEPYADVYGRRFTGDSVAAVRSRIERYERDKNMRMQSFVIHPGYVEVR